MYGIDMSHWQGDNALKTKYDFLIHKATEGLNYVDPTVIDRLKTLNYQCPIGLYHFMTRANAIFQARWFYDALVKLDAIYKAMPILDYEAEALKLGASGVDDFMAEFKRLAGVNPVLYCSYSVLLEKPELWKYDIWMARYPNKKETGYTKQTRYKTEIIRQFTSNGKLSGYNGYLDLNQCFITPELWAMRIPKKPDTATSNIIPDVQIAYECVLGNWGNGADRKKRIQNAGYPYAKIQALINEAEAIALEVIAGKWGNGAARKKKLEKAGYNYNLVQAWVNVLGIGKHNG